jgi:hypothetical protein
MLFFEKIIVVENKAALMERFNMYNKMMWDKVKEIEKWMKVKKV